jgi:hypothetical protein
MLASQAGRARRTIVRGPKFEVFGTSNPELRTSDRARLASLASPVLLAYLGSGSKFERICPSMRCFLSRTATETAQRR